MNVGGTGALLKDHQQVENGRLHRHVERRQRLVAHDQLRLGRERAGDGDALLLPAGELLRVAQRRPRGVGQVDPGQKLAHPLFDALAPQPGVLAHHLVDLVADPERRIERGLRVLVDHGDARALDGAQLARAEAQQVDVVEPDRARGDPPRRIEAAHHRERERALARAALADHRQGLAGAHRVRRPVQEQDVDRVPRKDLEDDEDQQRDADLGDGQQPQPQDQVSEHGLCASCARWRPTGPAGPTGVSLPSEPRPPVAASSMASRSIAKRTAWPYAHILERALLDEHDQRLEQRRRGDPDLDVRIGLQLADDLRRREVHDVDLAGGQGETSEFMLLVKKEIGYLSNE